MSGRIIGHLDMDAFFAAIEERNSPQFRGLPLVVGSDPKEGRGRGVVSTASYPARRYGIHSAQPITTAWRLAQEAARQGRPRAVFLPTNHRLYAMVSEAVFAFVRSRVPLVEQTSIDEAYLELSSLETFEAAEQFVQELQRALYTRERLTCSIGVGPNKLIAKIAAGRRKPHGLTVVRPAEAASFLAPLPARDLPGVGPKTEAVLLKKDIRTIGEITRLSLRELEGLFGAWGKALYFKARGVDESRVSENRAAKSIGEQETFERDTREMSHVIGRLLYLARLAFGRLRHEGFVSFRTVTVIVRFSNFQTKNRSHTLKAPCSDGNVLKRELIRLVLPFLDARENPRKLAIRLVGVRLEKLETRDSATLGVEYE